MVLALEDYGRYRRVMQADNVQLDQPGATAGGGIPYFWREDSVNKESHHREVTLNWNLKEN